MEPIILATLFAGVVAGLALGAIGGGGSVLLIPLLVFGFGLDVHEATGTALVVVLTTSTLGAVLHGRPGGVRLREAGLFAAPGIRAAVASQQLVARGGHPRSCRAADDRRRPQDLATR